jgi:UDP-glucose 4-epimerase
LADIMVTGGAGFIGSNLIDKLISQGYSIAVIDDLSTGNKDNLPENIRLHRVDVRSAAVHRIFDIEKPKYLFHLAAQLNVRRSVSDPAFDADVNVMGVINLLQSARDAGAEKIIFTSTVIGEAGVVAVVYDRMLAGEEAVINGDGSQTRDFVYVGDVVNALVKAIDHDECDIFNIGTSKETSILELFRTMREIAGSNQREKFGPAKSGEQLRSVITYDRAREKLGWEPVTDLKTGLQHTYEYFKSKYQHLPAGV